MATTPLSSALITGLEGKTAIKLSTLVGPVFTPRFFCCDDPNSLGISAGKTPVAHFTLSPNPGGTAETINYDGTSSYDPDGSITGYAWTFESHTPSTGTASTGTLSYDAEGTFTIQLIVTDGTGLKSAPARKELVIKDIVLNLWAATSNGVYQGIATSPVTWTDKNTGLSGDDLVANDVKITPATRNETTKTIWRATDGGVQVSTDTGATWTEKNPGTVTNQWGDGTAPTVSDLNFQAIAFDGTRVFTAATWQSGSDYRSWVFYTDDDGDNWTQLTTNWDA